MRRSRATRRTRGSTSERGYGSAHQKERERYKPAVDAGREYCRRCLRPIPPAGRGPCPRCGKNHHGWDLGHHDLNRNVWTGPEHQCCNRATAGRRKMVKRVQDVMRRTSREW